MTEGEGRQRVYVGASGERFVAREARRDGATTLELAIAGEEARTIHVGYDAERAQWWAQGYDDCWGSAEAGTLEAAVAEAEGLVVAARDRARADEAELQGFVEREARRAREAERRIAQWLDRAPRGWSAERMGAHGALGPTRDYAAETGDEEAADIALRYANDAFAHGLPGDGDADQAMTVRVREGARDSTHALRARVGTGYRAIDPPRARHPAHAGRWLASVEEAGEGAPEVRAYEDGEGGGTHAAVAARHAERRDAERGETPATWRTVRVTARDTNEQMVLRVKAERRARWTLGEPDA